MPLRNMFFCLLVVISIVGVVGCLADIESVRVDETLIGYKGQIIEKTQITEIDKERRYAMERASINREFAGPVGDIFTAFGVGLLDVTISGQPVKYSVTLENKKNVVVYSHYNGFEVEQCVIVLVAQETQEVRMTSASGCGNN